MGKSRSLSLIQLDQKYQNLHSDLTLGLLALVSLILFGTLGYQWLEGWSSIDSLFMTVITLTTIGFGETHPLDDRGRIFTMVLIGLGIVIITYIGNKFTQALVEGYFQKTIQVTRQRKIMESLNNHYIICGFGRAGRQVTSEFAAEGVPFVVVDTSLEQIEIAEELGYKAIQGDATLDHDLLKVGIERAVCLICTLPSDAENLYTVMSAKTLNPQIRAIARASNEEAIKKMRRGGADEVVSPYITGGKRMAAAALRPQVMDFMDGILSGKNRSYYIEEFRLDANCPYLGQSLQEARMRSKTGALVLAIRRYDGELIGGPSAETLIQTGDVFICMGTPEQLRELNQLLSPTNQLPRTPRNI
ncbi:K+ transport system, NAD-binding component [Synechococcus sp. PCC 7502]|uniref:potassium channel family protein n=1 Tax=Synechococcus sp. PCC 7502 TaxID=1173263 RepID=UPI00029FF722|nr:potassium channel protein [Synechococcus sp. PCC 7502]AFY75083.1 K+ transport system, NAD-binding component [Synechococcus sp. PCC 7502]